MTNNSINPVKGEEGKSEITADYILDCPFCGGRPIWVHLVHPSGVPGLSCPTCNFMMKRDRHDKAVSNWNHRVKPISPTTETPKTDSLTVNIDFEVKVSTNSNGRINGFIPEIDTHFYGKNKDDAERIVKSIVKSFIQFWSDYNRKSTSPKMQVERKTLEECIQEVGKENAFPYILVRINSDPDPAFQNLIKRIYEGAEIYASQFQINATSVKPIAVRTLQECKNEVAQRFGYDSYESYVNTPTDKLQPEHNDWEFHLSIVDEAAESYAQASQPSQAWIKVSEELPDESGHVLIYCPTDLEASCIMATGFYIKGQDHIHYPHHNTPVTHWMPLPLAPK